MFIFYLRNRDHSRPVERVEFADAVGFGRAAVTAGWDGFVLLYLCDENAVRGTGWRLTRRFKGCEGAWVVSLATSPRAVVAGDTDGRMCAWTFGSSTQRDAAAGRVGDEGAIRSKLRRRERRARGVRVDPRGRGDLGSRGGNEARHVAGPRGGGVARAPPRPQPRRDPHRAHVFEGLHAPDVALRRGGPRRAADAHAARATAVDVARVDVAGPRRRGSLVAVSAPPSRRARATNSCAPRAAPTASSSCATCRTARRSRG